MLNKLPLTRVGKHLEFKDKSFIKWDVNATVFYEMTELDTFGKSAQVGRSYERPMLH